MQAYLRDRTLALGHVIAGDVVHVESGTYAAGSGETFELVLPDQVSLMGVSRKTVIIDAGGVSRAINATNCVTSGLIAGLTVQRGNVTGAGYGGGIYGSDTLIVSNCILRANNAASCGGGGIVDGGTVSRNIILGNRAGSDGAAGIEGTGDRVENNVIAGNITWQHDPGQEGGIACSGITLVKNNTIAYNLSDTIGGINANGTDTIIRNCIIWGNRGTTTNDINNGDNSVITYSDIEDASWGNGTCIHANPKFYAPQGFSTGLTDTVLSDSSANWTPGELVGAYLNPNTNNTTLPLVFLITGNTATNIACAGGGLSAVANPGDGYRVEDYHLRSSGGRYTCGLGYIHVDEKAENSPCIDAGDPNDPFLTENADPFKRGDRINMGAFGNTSEAALTDLGPVGTVFSIL